MKTFILKLAGNKIKENLDDRVTHHDRKCLKTPRSWNMSLLRLNGGKLALVAFIKYVNSAGERLAKERSTSYGGRERFSGINYVSHKYFSIK